MKRIIAQDALKQCIEKQKTTNIGSLLFNFMIIILLADLVIN